MKYQAPKLHPMDESFPAYGACVSGENAARPSSCLAGVGAARSACTQGVHPEFSCTSGTLPGENCAAGTGDSEW